MYIIIFILQLIATVFAAGIASSLILHAFGSCWLFVTFIDDLTIEEIALNAYNRKKQNKWSDIQFYEQFGRFIDFHSEIKQLSFHSQYSIE